VALLSANNLRAYYHSAKGLIRAVDGVDLEIEQGEVLGIAGESGCGKSTLGHVLMMNIRPPLAFFGGEIMMEGLSLARFSRDEVKARVWGKLISLVPQSAQNALVPTRRVGALIQDVLNYHLKMNGRAALDLAEKRFAELDLPLAALTKYPHELSGGMKQRVVISIATLLNPQLLIVDEPTSALDVSSQKQALSLFLRLKERGIVKGIVFIAHDISTLRQIADRIAVMYAGKIVEVSPVDKILARQWHPYTEGLLGSVITPEPEVKKRGLSHIAGDPPDLLNPPAGCRFQPRCPRAIALCTLAEPPLIRIDGDSLAACHLVSGSDSVKGA
jgi:peptide/nickel transport system ATP-binding protein